MPMSKKLRVRLEEMQRAKNYMLVFVNDKGRRIGEDHHRAKLTDKDVELVLYLHDAGLGYDKIAAKFDDVPGGISRYTVRDIVTSRRRAQTPFATRRVLVKR